MQTARDDVQAGRRIWYIDEVVSICVNVRGKCRTRVTHQVIEAPPQEFDRLTFQLALPPLVFLEHRARCCAERTVIEKNNIWIEQEKLFWERSLIGECHFYLCKIDLAYDNAVEIQGQVCR
jgi:hypothetical protein